MKLILVRHGETEENGLGILQGWKDNYLNKEGVKQAKKVAQRLKEEKIDVAYSSDLSRCVETAEEILKFHPLLKLIKDKQLREQDKGIFEGKTKKERAAQFKTEEELSKCIWHPEGGEAWPNMWERIFDFLEIIKKKHTQETVLVVGHGGPISCLLRYFHGEEPLDNTKFICTLNTSISEILIEGRNIKFLTKSCAKHLD